MPVAVSQISLDVIAPLTLEQLINNNQKPSVFPLACHINEKQITITNSCLLAPEQYSISSSDFKTSQSSLELVVFSTLKVEVFTQIITKCQLSIFAINAINLRNNLTSYRFKVECQDLASARAALINITTRENIEAAIIDNAPRLSTPGILVMDMDSTTIDIECIDEIAALAGVGEQVSAVTELAMQGKLDFAQSLHQRVATLKGAPESILAQVANDIPLMAGLEILNQELKAHGWYIAIASGGFTYFADHLKDLLSLDAAHANLLEIKDGTLTGKVLGDVVDAQAKADCLLSLAKQYQIPFQQTVAIGDGANDLVMMEAAHLGIAFRAKEIVLKQADSSINKAGLDCLLHWFA